MELEFSDATTAALEIIKGIYGDKAKDYRIEELFVPDPPTKPDWVITIGFSVPDPNPTPRRALAIALSAGEEKERYERVYKRVTLDELGALKSVENRLVP